MASPANTISSAVSSPAPNTKTSSKSTGGDHFAAVLADADKAAPKPKPAAHKHDGAAKPPEHKNAAAKTKVASAGKPAHAAPTPGDAAKNTAGKHDKPDDKADDRTDDKTGDKTGDTTPDKTGSKTDDQTDAKADTKADKAGDTANSKDAAKQDPPANDNDAAAAGIVLPQMAQAQAQSQTPVPGAPGAPGGTSAVAPAALQAAAEAGDGADESQAAGTLQPAGQNIDAKAAKPGDFKKMLDQEKAAPAKAAADAAAAPRADDAKPDAKQAEVQTDALAAAPGSAPAAAPTLHAAGQEAASALQGVTAPNGAAPASASQAAAQAAAQTAAQAPQPAPDVPGLAIAIAAKSQSGAKQFDIRLDPPELGRVEVRLSIDASGKAEAHLSADRPQTLDLLQKDAPALTRALRDAGLYVAQDGLNFSLRNQQQQSGGGQSDSRGGSRTNFISTARLSESAATSTGAYAGRALGLLDIKV